MEIPKLGKSGPWKKCATQKKCSMKKVQHEKVQHEQNMKSERNSKT